MKNIFCAGPAEAAEDKELVVAAQKGSKDALESLIKRHQGWIYNIAVRMVGSPEDAQDVTQEILIKIVTRLSTFQHKSSLRTWLYRIVTNHVINRKRNLWERIFISLESHTDFKNSLESSEFGGGGPASVEAELIVEETRTLCMTGMLLCLDRTQRMIFILGSILGIDSKQGGAFLEMTPDNFRKILSRTRKRLARFMDGQCGVINEKNACRCQAKTRACIEAGIIDPDRPRLDRDHLLRIRGFISQNRNKVEDALEMKVREAFRNQPVLKSPDFSPFLRTLLKKQDINRIKSTPAANKNNAE